MIGDKRVVAFTPYGRVETVSILLYYLQREHDAGRLDEWWLCMNTDPNQTRDVKYAWALGRERDWIKVVDRPAGVPRLTPKQRNTGYFYRYMTDPQTVYVRYDDDIVYLHPDALTSLVTAKTKTEGSVLTSFGLIWNNAICSWYLQQHGKIPGADEGWEQVQQPYCMDPIGWASGSFAIRLHELLLDTLEADGDAAAQRFYLYQDVPLAPRQQFSVSNFAVLGTDYAALDPPGHLDYPEEEHWHTVHRPGRVGMGNQIIGNSLVAHYTFHPQQRMVRATNILQRYRALAESTHR